MNISVSKINGTYRMLLAAGALAAGSLIFASTGSVHAEAPSTGIAAPAGVADSGGWPQRIQGEPSNFQAGSEGGYYLWHDDNGLHLWVTDPEGIDSHYTGSVTTSGTITNISLQRPESDDSYQQVGDGQIVYDLHTQSGIDGLNFEVTGGAGTSLTFDLYRDGHKVATDHIWEGANDANVNFNPVTLFRH